MASRAPLASFGHRSDATFCGRRIVALTMARSRPSLQPLRAPLVLLFRNLGSVPAGVDAPQLSAERLRPILARQVSAGPKIEPSGQISGAGAAPRLAGLPQCAVAHRSGRRDSVAMIDPPRDGLIMLTLLAMALLVSLLVIAFAEWLS